MIELYHVCNTPQDSFLPNDELRRPLTDLHDNIVIRIKNAIYTPGMQTKTSIHVGKTNYLPPPIQD
jgi:hypothetical protein